MKNIVNSRKCLVCKKCCYFESKNDAKLAPFFSDSEIKKLGKNKKFLVKNKNGFFQSRTIKIKNGKGYYCTFLNKNNYKCKIYKKRPMDCESWPFVVGYNKNRTGVYLWVANENYCPSAKIKKIKSSLINEIINFLDKKFFIKEIKNKERFIWPYEGYMIKLKKIKI